MNMEEIKVPLKKIQKVIGLEMVPSTQDMALELARRDEPEGTMLLANAQTAARRQDGSRFHAAAGGIYFTLILRPEHSGVCAQDMAGQTAQAVAETVTSIFGIKTNVKDSHAVFAWDMKNRKWKKIAGVLAETFFEPGNEFVLVGVGLNVNNRVPCSGKEPQACLKQWVGSEISRELLLEELIACFWKYYAIGCKSF